MMRSSPFNRKKLFIGAILIAPMLVLGFVVFALPLLPKEGLGEVTSKTTSSLERRGSTFPITHIDGIDWVENAIRKDASHEQQRRLKPAATNSPLSPVSAAVLPHHTLPAEELLTFWQQIADTTHPSVIVLIGPNHENAGAAQVQTTMGVWPTPFGSLKTQNDLVERLVSSGSASDEPASFVNEHAIGTHAPYLAKLFPDVPIIPIIGKSTAGIDDARRLVRSLSDVLPDDALVVASIDFSHYLPQQETAQMDAETLAHIAARRTDDIERLGSDHLDSPFAMIAFLFWIDAHDWQEELVWHGFSHDILGNALAPGTSYLVYFAPPCTVRCMAPPLTISAVGDIMLSRAVGKKLTTVPYETAFAPARDALLESDLVFGNLESVLSTSTVEIQKEIRFKADPSLVSALTFMGFTNLSVANNHIGDYGEAAWNESVAHLREAGIAPIGGYRNDGEMVLEEVQGKKIAFLAYEMHLRPLSTEAIQAKVREATEAADLVVISFHWGNEYQHTPHASQIELAHAVIDAGADVVIGHHPHVLQSIERYNDGLILYSLGNFIFDQFGEDQNESVVARLSWSDDQRSLELVPMRIDGYFPRTANEEERSATLDRLASWSFGVDDGELVDGVVEW